MPKRGLGRGLGAILGDDAVASAAEKRQEKRKASAETRVRTKKSGTAGDTENDVSRETSLVKLSLIEPNSSQPRKNFDEEGLAELAASIKEHGVIQPIVIKKTGRTYSIVVGERRWRAARMAGLTEIPAIIKELNERETAEIALIENIQRENLNSIEEAKAYRSLIDDYGLTQEELSRRVSKNRTTITNSLRLLQLDDDILELISGGELSAGHARAILAISGKRDRYKAAREIVNGGLSVRDAEKLARRYSSQTKPRQTAEAAADEQDIYTAAVADELTERMHVKVSIVKKGKKAGRVQIEYSSEQELEDIIDKLRSACVDG